MRRKAPLRFRAGEREAGLVLVGLLLLFALLVPLLSPYDGRTQDYGALNQPPSAAHWFGTDPLGRDQLVRVAEGTRVSLLIGVGAAGAAGALGTAYGGIAALVGGRWEEGMMRIVDLCFGLPAALVLILFTLWLGRGLDAILLALSLTLWLPVARIARGEFARQMGRAYFAGARAIGAGPCRLLLRHLLPNAAAPILVTLTLLVPEAIFLEAFLGFIGLGVEPPHASLGALVEEGLRSFRSYPWQVAFPSLAILWAVLGFNLVGDGFLARLAGPAGRRPAPVPLLAPTPSGPALPSPLRGGRSGSGGAEPFLSVRDLRVAFDRVRAVDGVTFELARGEVVALVGESGAGKSLTALALIGLLPPPARLSGSIRLEGEELVGAPARRWERVRRHRFGFVFQDPADALDPVRTVGAHLIETTRWGGLPLPAARARARDLLTDVGLPEADRVLDALPYQLSGGQRQRVALALALANRPALLIADEPTSALDVTLQRELLALLLRRRREWGMGILLITHDLGLVAEAADRVLVMYAGRLVEAAPVDAIFARPRHPYTAALLRAVPRIDREGRAEPIAGEPPHPSARPQGCPFRPRCALAAPLCRAEPPFRSVGEGHHAACHFA